jgi:hypothetical protein
VNSARPPAAVALALCACGPIAATGTIHDAESAVERAHAAEGEKYAPYETTLADLYLQKAHEEQGHARYSQARDLASEAQKLAVTARSKAVERRGAGPDLAPAQPAVIQREELPPPPMPPQKPGDQSPPQPAPKP